MLGISLSDKKLTINMVSLIYEWLSIKCILEQGITNFLS
jgi:hypothetical protein